MSLTAHHDVFPIVFPIFGSRRRARPRRLADLARPTLRRVAALVAPWRARDAAASLGERMLRGVGLARADADVAGAKPIRRA